ncbi:AAA family ATPase [Candidatus Jidaibacter acanthamoebae]|nr:hypothetical protein [Candidatus Jidaibacter acanthamoeba]
MTKDKNQEHPPYLNSAIRSLFLNKKRTINQEYLNTFNELYETYHNLNQLPFKPNLDEEENSKYDINRLNFINKALNFINDYYILNKQRYKKSLNIAELELTKGDKTLHPRKFISYVCFTIYNLSGNLRSKYKYLLQPQPFTWETFEQLGGFLKQVSASYIHMNIYSHITASCEEEQKRLFHEYQHVKLITNAAIPTILHFDVPKLITLFGYIKNCEENSVVKQKEIAPIKLLAIKAYTRRVVDTENLIYLLNNSDNTYALLDLKKIAPLINKAPGNTGACLLMMEKDDKCYERQFNLNTKLGRHAALRRLEKIGEFITGKNFSSSLTKLDATIDWQAFIVVRDTIAHQDQGSNKTKIEKLLANNNLFLSVLRDEMQEFFNRLNQIITLRDKNLPRFREDEIDKFWQEVYLYEQRAQEPARKEKQIQARASKDNAKIIIDTLKELKADIKLQMKWINILNGRLEIPSTKEKGELFKVLSSLRRQKPELFKQCQDIIDKATNGPSTKKSKEQIMKEQQEAKVKKRIEEEKNLSGLVNLRTLAQSFKEDSGSKLNRIQKIEAAIEALENIKEFIEQDEFLKENLTFLNIKNCTTQGKLAALKLSNMLANHPEFSDSIEYNINQSLQYIDNIKKFAEAKGKKYLDQDYDYIRNLRNYLVHGNYLMDKEEKDKDFQNKGLFTSRQIIIVNTIFILIFDLIPILKEVKQEIVAKDNRQYKDNIIKALATIQQFSQSLRNSQQLSYHNGNIPVDSDYFSYLPSEVTTRILLYVPEIHPLSVSSIQESLAAYCKSKVPSKEEIKTILNSPEQLSYRQRLIAEREDMSINLKSM